MPHPTKDWDIQDNNPYIAKQLAYNHANEESFALQHIERLNANQLSAFNMSYLSVSCNLGKVSFLMGLLEQGKHFYTRFSVIMSEVMAGLLSASLPLVLQLCLSLVAE
jgi:hypothetical protein